MSKAAWAMPAIDDDLTGRRIADLIAERAEHRRLLYAETCACHDMVASWHGREIDRISFEITLVEREDFRAGIERGDDAD